MPAESRMDTERQRYLAHPSERPKGCGTPASSCSAQMNSGVKLLVRGLNCVIRSCETEGRPPASAATTSMALLVSDLRNP